MKTQLDVRLSEVTSLDDIGALAHINEQALEGDPLKIWMARYTERTEYQSTVTAVKAALNDSKSRIVKATIAQDGQDLIIGFVHWENGWIKLDQVDPFAQPDVKDVIKVPEVLEVQAEAADPDLARRLKIGEDGYVHTRNFYIGAVRGKKHNFIRRLMVLPKYQGYGIGRKLLQVVTRQADEQKIVCWLFSRPKGEPLYLKAGFEQLGATQMDVPEDGLVCPRTLAMMRLPQPL